MKRYEVFALIGCDNLPFPQSMEISNGDWCKYRDVAELEKELYRWKSEYMKVDNALKLQIDRALELEKQEPQ